MDTPNGLLGQRAVPLAQADYSIESASVKIQRNRMAGKIVYLWGRIEKKRFVTRIYAQVDTILFVT